MFKRITAENLFSWEKLDYTIPGGISQVTGWNSDDQSSEGSGKSSCFNILSWVLYGKIPKDAKIDDVIRQGQKSGSGVVELKSGQWIYRSRSPNKLQILEVNGTITQGKDAKETQLLINKLIGLDFDSFCQAVYFAQDYPKRFIKANETEKVGVLSDIQNLSVFDQARSATMDRIKASGITLQFLTKEKTRIEAEKSKLNSNAALLAEFLERFEEDKNNDILKHQIDIKDSHKKITEAQKDVIDVNEITAEIQHTEKLIDHLAKKRTECSTDIKLYDQRLREQKQLRKSIEDWLLRKKALGLEIAGIEAADHECPLCGAHVNTDALDRVFKRLKQAKVDYGAVVDNLTKADVDIKALGDVTPPDKARDLIVEMDKETTALKGVSAILTHKKHASATATSIIALHEKTVIEKTNALKLISNKEPTVELDKLMVIDTALAGVEAEYSNIVKALEENKALTDRLNILKDGFKTIKSYVFQSVLAELSRRATAYAAELFEIPVKVLFDNESEDGEISKINTEVVLNGVSRPLSLTSGGQFARIGMSIDLALSDIVASRSTNPISFRILDEPFKNMSETSMAKAVKLLEGLKGASVIIEHSPLIKSIVNNTFHVEYSKGISHAG